MKNVSILKKTAQKELKTAQNYLGIPNIKPRTGNFYFNSNINIELIFSTVALFKEYFNSRREINLTHRLG
jgi:hypothetical protein